MVPGSSLSIVDVCSYVRYHYLGRKDHPDSHPLVISSLTTSAAPLGRLRQRDSRTPKLCKTVGDYMTREHRLFVRSTKLDTFMSLASLVGSMNIPRDSVAFTTRRQMYLLPLCCTLPSGSIVREFDVFTDNFAHAVCRADEHMHTPPMSSQKFKAVLTSHSGQNVMYEKDPTQ